VRKFFRSPWLEVNFMLAVIIICYVAMGLITWGAETPPGSMSGGEIWGWLLGFFLLSFAIAMVAVIGWLSILGSKNNMRYQDYKIHYPRPIVMRIRYRTCRVVIDQV